MTNNDPAEVSVTTAASTAVSKTAVPTTTTATAAVTSIRPTLDKHYGRQASFLTKLSTGTGALPASIGSLKRKNSTSGWV